MLEELEELLVGFVVLIVGLNVLLILCLGGLHIVTGSGGLRYHESVSSQDITQSTETDLPQDSISPTVQERIDLDTCDELYFK